jgi:serine protease Do
MLIMSEEYNYNDNQNTGNTSNWNEAPRYEAPSYTTSDTDTVNQGNANYGTTDYSTANYSMPNYEAPKYEAPNYNVPQNEPQKKKDKKPGFGVKLAKVAAVAAVFGLVAGCVFQGVGLVADSFHKEDTRTTIETPVAATTTTTGSTEADTDLTQLVKNSMPSMVSITSTITTNYSYFGQKFSEDEEGSGSGIIVGMNNKELLIATNNHVIDGATTIQVSFIDDEVVEAEVKGTDSTADLAVVSVPLEDIKESTLQSIKVATLGDSDTVQLGEKVVAIGNALGYGQSVTVGYISATNREVSVTSGTSQNTMTLLQTDAAINPGNSGGALLNMNGEVIGINSVKYADTSVEGMGYAIPISSATPIINELMNYEKLTDDEKGYLGITGTDITEENNLYNMPTGVYVYELATGGAAEKGGMQKGDIITAINGNAVTNMEAVKQKVNNTRVGTEITVTVMRNENGEYIEKELTITLQGKDSLNSLTTEENNTSQSQQQTTPYTEEEEDEYDFGNGLLDDFLRRFGY